MREHGAGGAFLAIICGGAGYDRTRRSSRPCYARRLNFHYKGFPSNASNTSPWADCAAMSPGTVSSTSQISVSPCACSASMPHGKRCGRRDYKRSLALPLGLWQQTLMKDARQGLHSLVGTWRFLPLSPQINRAFPGAGPTLCASTTAFTRRFSDLPVSLFSVAWPLQAGSLKFSPRCSTAQHMRAFLAAIATTARQ